MNDAKPIAAGELNRRVRIWRRTLGEPDALGTPVETWAEHATRWSKVRPLTARELYYAAEVQSEATTAFEFRYDADLVRLTDELEYNGERYAVHSVIDDADARRRLIVQASKREANA